MFTRNSMLAVAASVMFSTAASAAPVNFGAPAAAPVTPAPSTGGAVLGGGAFNGGFVPPTVIVPSGGFTTQSFFYGADADENDRPQRRVIREAARQQFVQPHIVEPLIQEWNTPTKRRAHHRVIRGKSTVHHRR